MKKYIFILTTSVIIVLTNIIMLIKHIRLNFVSIEYEIYLVKNKVKEKEISEKFIKMYLTDHNNIPLDGFEKNLIPVFSNLVILNDKANGKLLYRGKINANSKLKFKLRIWVSDSYAISKENEQFSFSINVRAI